eukprot:Awhi_evm1s12875
MMFQKLFTLATTVFAVNAIAEFSYPRFESDAVPTGICDTVNSQAGYFHVLEDKKYFYWFFESRNEPSTDPIFVWMTGGPGCSSQIALFHENGPCKIDDNHKTTTASPTSWNTKANVIYIDQPAGVGFSTGTEDDHTEGDVGDNMYLFVQEFLKANPQFQENEFFVVGESYGGHYVPPIVKRIIDGNKNVESQKSQRSVEDDGSRNGDIKINIQGMAIGNGLTDPENQYDQYCPYALNNGYEVLTGKVNSWISMHTLWPVCRALIERCGKTEPGATPPASCTGGMVACQLLMMRCSTGLRAKNLNIYNVKEECKFPPMCYDFTDVENFLAQEHVREALSVKELKWASCNPEIQMNFMGDQMRNYAPVVKDILEEGVRVLIYAGDADFICNWMGNEAWTKKLKWSQSSEFSSEELQKWTGDGGKAKGEMRQAGPFTFLRVYDSGHMVPLDQPESALLMINKFFANELKYDEK